MDCYTFMQHGLSRDQWEFCRWQTQRGGNHTEARSEKFAPNHAHGISHHTIWTRMGPPRHFAALSRQPLY